MDRARQRQIMRDDVKRRNAREAEELASLLGFYDAPNVTKIAPGTMVVRADARAMGATTALTHRASRSSWLDSNGQLRGRVRGYAGSVANGVASTDPDTVLVRYADGSTEIRTVASFRADGPGQKVRKAAPRAASIPETASAKYGTNILTGE